MWAGKKEEGINRGRGKRDPEGSGERQVGMQVGWLAVLFATVPHGRAQAVLWKGCPEKSPLGHRGGAGQQACRDVGGQEESRHPEQRLAPSPDLDHISPDCPSQGRTVCQGAGAKCPSAAVTVEGHRAAAISQLCTLGRSLNLSEPQSSPLYDGESVCGR